MQLVIYSACLSAECSSPAAAASRRRRQRPVHRPGHHEQVRATHSERRRGQRPRHHDQVPATLKERLLGQRPGGHHDQVPETTAAGNRLATTIKYLRGAADIGLGATIKYPRCTTTQRPGYYAKHNERRHGQRIGHLDQVSTTHNERRRGQRPKPMPGITHVPLHHMRPALALLSTCLLRQQAE
jgi:hypothetical protein